MRIAAAAHDARQARFENRVGARPGSALEIARLEGDRDRRAAQCAFAVPAQNTFGNGGREIIDGPGFVNLDFSIFRRFPMAMIREGADLTLRVESFNFTNTPNFNAPNTSVGNRNFGRITSARNPRNLQIGIKFLF